MADYETQKLRVDPTPEYLEGRAEFVGKEAGRATAILRPGEKEVTYGFSLSTKPQAGGTSCAW